MCKEVSRDWQKHSQKLQREERLVCHECWAPTSRAFGLYFRFLQSLKQLLLWSLLLVAQLQPGPKAADHDYLSLLSQGRACDILGKEDRQDFLNLVQALEGISLSDDQLTSTWAVLAAVLQLGNICFTSSEVHWPLQPGDGLLVLNVAVTPCDGTRDVSLDQRYPLKTILFFWY